MGIITIKRGVAGWLSIVAAAVAMLFCALPSWADMPALPQTTVTKSLPVPTTPVITETATIVVTQTAVVTTTQKVVEQSSVILTKIEGSTYTAGFIVAGVGLTLLGMWLFFMMGYREGNNDSRDFVKEALQEIKERDC